jgi:SAM-dependent methyltransferase
VTAVVQRGSSSLAQPDYWWYRARSALLETVLGTHLGRPGRTLDVGSADGPSVGWMRRGQPYVAVDLLPQGLVPGESVCASLTALPFRDDAFDVVAAFDVVEHCADDRAALTELGRVLAPGGRLLLSVPAYGWAWSDHDVQAGHHRRYTRPQLVALVREAGLEVHRATYAFGATLPLFVGERAARRIRARRGSAPDRLTRVSPAAERLLLALTEVDRRVLAHRDLPCGSSVFLAASRPA